MEFPQPKERPASPEEKTKKEMAEWPECYYREREGLQRRELLDEADRNHLTPEENKIRRLLWERRYPGLVNSREKIKDSYLRAWFDFRYAADNASGLFSYKKIVREISRDLEQMGFQAVKEFGETGEAVLYRELYHMAMLYITLCQEDKGYGSLLFGMGKVSEDSVAQRIAKEIVKVVCLVPKKLNLEQECALWTKACLTAFADAYPDKKGDLENLIREMK